MFLQSHSHHGDENGHVEQIGNGVRARGNGTGFGCQRDFPFQDFGRLQFIGATSKLVHAQDHSCRILVREAQEPLLDFDGVGGLFALLARRHGADGLAWNIRGGPGQSAAHAQRCEHQQGAGKREMINQPGPGDEHICL